MSSPFPILGCAWSPRISQSEEKSPNGNSTVSPFPPDEAPSDGGVCMYKLTASWNSRGVQLDGRDPESESIGVKPLANSSGFFLTPLEGCPLSAGLAFKAGANCELRN